MKKVNEVEWKREKRIKWRMNLMSAASLSGMKRNGRAVCGPTQQRSRQKEWKQKEWNEWTAWVNEMEFVWMEFVAERATGLRPHLIPFNTFNSSNSIPIPFADWMFSFQCWYKIIRYFNSTELRVYKDTTKVLQQQIKNEIKSMMEWRHWAGGR